MGKTDDRISPYLKRRLRSYEEAVRDRAERDRGSAGTKVADRKPDQKGEDDAEPGR